MLQQELTLRDYIASDLANVLNLHRIAMQELGVYIDGPVNDDLLNIENNYLKDKGTFIVGIMDNAIVSMGAFRFANDNIAEIKRMRTYPEYQGRGFGTIILKELIARAKSLNYKELILETSEKQIAAIKLYTNNGFKEFKRDILFGFNCIYFKLLL